MMQELRRIKELLVQLVGKHYSVKAQKNAP
jgi:hypothetical protein